MSHKYIRKYDITPGCSYIDGRGVEYLFLGYLDIQDAYLPDGFAKEGGSDEKQILQYFAYARERKYYYVKINKKYLEKSRKVKTLQEFLDQIIYKTNEKGYRFKHYFCITKKQKRFVKQGKIMLPGTIEPHIIKGKDIVINYFEGYYKEKDVVRYWYSIK